MQSAWRANFLDVMYATIGATGLISSYKHCTTCNEACPKLSIDKDRIWASNERKCDARAGMTKTIETIHKCSSRPVSINNVAISSNFSWIPARSSACR